MVVGLNGGAASRLVGGLAPGETRCLQMKSG